MATPKTVTAPINIGNPHEFTILDLAKMVIELTNSRSRIVHRPLPEDDPKQRQPDVSRAKALLDWAPCTSLQDGLVLTIRYFETLLGDQKVRASLMADTP